MNEFTLGFLIAGVVAWIFTQGYNSLIIIFLLAFRKVKGARIELLDLVHENNHLWIDAKHSIWQAKNEFIYETGRADVKKVFKSSWFVGKSDKVELRTGDYMVIPGKLIKNTVILKGTNNLRGFFINRVKQIQTMHQSLMIDNRRLAAELARFKARYKVDFNSKLAGKSFSKRRVEGERYYEV